MIVTTALAVGEAVSATGPEIIAACVAGYEMITRIGSVAPGEYSQRSTMLKTAPKPISIPDDIASRCDAVTEREGWMRYSVKVITAPHSANAEGKQRVEKK